jgi:LuxR family maltose regulon positive regulatory protein
LTTHDARVLLEQAGVALSDAALALLVERTEGWAAGLRLAALSLARHPDPERFAVEFSGSERTIAEYLLTEVLERQPEAVRRLLLRTSILDKVNGPLADLLTGNAGGERILQELESANALVVSLDASRSWFRYHHLLADLLRLELRRSEPAELPSLHAVAAEWYAAHRYPVEAVRHTQAAEKWALAARRLFDHWVELGLDGQVGTAHELLAVFPAEAVAADAELTTLMAADEINRGSLDKAARYLELAQTRCASVAADRRERFEVMCALQHVYLARQRTDVAGVLEAAKRLLPPAKPVDTKQLELGDDLRALALLSLGIAEIMAARLEEADRHLEQGITLAHRIARSYLEVYGLAQWASLGTFRSFDIAIERGLQAIELARQHGWSEEPILVNAYVTVALCRLWRGELEGAEQWLQHAERVVRPDVDPAMGLVVCVARAELEVVRGRHRDALTALRGGEQLPGLLVAPRPIALHTRGFLLQTLVRRGETQTVEAELNELTEQERDSGEMRMVLAVLRLALGKPSAASAGLAPVLEGSEPLFHRNWLPVAFLLDAIARSSLGDAAAAGRALERALDLAEPDGILLPFILFPAPELLERHRRSRTAHGAFVSQILDRLAGQQPPPSSGAAASLLEPLSEGETRVLRYLPTNLSLPEIASELHLSTNTVKTHVRHVYAKLGAHGRTEAVERARRLRVLAPESRRL